MGIWSFGEATGELRGELKEAREEEEEEGEILLERLVRGDAGRGFSALNAVDTNGLNAEPLENQLRGVSTLPEL